MLGSRKLLTELLHCTKYPDPIANTGDTHLFEGSIVEFEQNITANVVSNK